MRITREVDLVTHILARIKMSYERYGTGLMLEEILEAMRMFDYKDEETLAIMESPAVLEFLIVMEFSSGLTIYKWRDSRNLNSCVIHKPSSYLLPIKGYEGYKIPKLENEVGSDKLRPYEKKFLEDEIIYMKNIFKNPD